MHEEHSVALFDVSVWLASSMLSPLSVFCIHRQFVTLLSWIILRLFGKTSVTLSSLKRNQNKQSPMPPKLIDTNTTLVQSNVTLVRSMGAKNNEIKYCFGRRWKNKDKACWCSTEARMNISGRQRQQKEANYYWEWRRHRNFHWSHRATKDKDK